MNAEQKGKQAKIEVENIGGIDQAKIEFEPGVTVLVGNNATNRTSLLTAVMGAHGSEKVALKGDADEGRVELTIDGNAYFREFNRTATGETSAGNPYLDDPTLADLFAFLLENNEARQAVARGDNLRDLIMRPVDTDEIQAKIEERTQHRDDLKNELEKLQSLKGRLPSLEEKRVDLQKRIDEKKTELEEIEAKLEQKDDDVESKRAKKNKLEQKLSDLQSKRSNLDDVRYELETEQDSLSELKSEQRELKEERSELSNIPAGKLGEIEPELERLRSRKQELESEVSELQSIIQFNEDMLEDVDGGTLSDIDFDNTEEDAITDQLLADDTVQCWTCGSTVNEEQVVATVDTLRELRQTKYQTIQEIDDEISELKGEKQTFERKKQRREKLDMQLQRVDRNVDKSQDRIQELKCRRDTLTTTIEEIEEDIDEQENEERSEVLALHKEANQLEYELGQLENEQERVQKKVSDIEGKIAREDELENQIDDTKEELAELRTKIDQIEQDAVEEFNRHMDAILERLEYDNLERIWLERLDTEVKQGRRKVSKTLFELHVVRNASSGASYEDTVDHLSESEREVTGLIFALAGYLTHNVYESVPFMALDSLEAIDAQRIAKLVDYFGGYSEYLLVALLPEDANALDEKYARVTDITA